MITIDSTPNDKGVALLGLDEELGILPEITAELLPDASNVYRAIPELADLAYTAYRQLLKHINSAFNHAVTYFGLQENPIICLSWKNGLL